MRPSLHLTSSRRLEPTEGRVEYFAVQPGDYCVLPERGTEIFVKVRVPHPDASLARYGAWADLLYPVDAQGNRVPDAASIWPWGSEVTVPAKIVEELFGERVA